MSTGRIVERVVKIISEQMNVEVCAVKEEVVLGFDEFDWFQVKTELEDEFDIEIDDDEIKECQKVGDVIKFVERLISQEIGRSR